EMLGHVFIAVVAVDDQAEMRLNIGELVADRGGDALHLGNQELQLAAHAAGCIQADDKVQVRRQSSSCSWQLDVPTLSTLVHRFLDWGRPIGRRDTDKKIAIGVDAVPGGDAHDAAVAARDQLDALAAGCGRDVYASIAHGFAVSIANSDEQPLAEESARQ